MEWTNCTGIVFDINDYLGFIYELVTTDGRYYIGRKQFWSKRGSEWYESDWIDYLSSSKELRGGIEDGSIELEQRNIIAVFTSKSAIRYAEATAIINSGSYLDRDKGLNWSFESCKGLIRLDLTDEQQMEHLEEYFNEDTSNTRYTS